MKVTLESIEPPTLLLENNFIYQDIVLENSENQN